MRTKAAILQSLGKPLIVDDIEIPKLGVGQVLVEIHYSGICGAQLGEISGAKGEDRFLPHLLGHEGAGVVIAKGYTSTGLKVGDKVVAHWREGRGIDAEFPVYGWNGGTVGGGKVTTFAQHAIISENRLTVVPDDTDLKKAALMGCSLTTGLGLINNEAKLKMGQSIMVIGCGGVGQSIIQGASMVSGYPIIAVDNVGGKLAQAYKLGAHMSLNTCNNESPLDFVELFKGLAESVDITVDTTGVPALIQGAWEITKEKLILVGQPHVSNYFTFDRARETFYKGKVMMDSQGGLTKPNVDIPKYLELTEADLLEIPEPIVYDLERVDDAIRSMRQGALGKIVLEMGHE